MNDGLLSEILVFLHFCFALFVGLGGILALWLRFVALLHLPALLWGVFIEFTGRICPLTPIENSLREQGRAAGYQAGFVEHYIFPILYPSGLTRSVQLALGITLVTLNAAVYWKLLRNRRPAQENREESA